MKVSLSFALISGSVHGTVIKDGDDFAAPFVNLRAHFTTGGRCPLTPLLAAFSWLIL